jgi:hypothetical protein
VFSYLDLPFDPSLLTGFRSVDLRARMGDPTGSERYEEVSREPLEKWRNTLRGPVRKRWCREYLRWIGAERLAMMGYDLDTLLAALDELPAGSRTVPSDVARGTYAWFDRVGRRTAAGILWRKRQR